MRESKSLALPLGYTPIKSGGEWIRTTEPKGTDLQSAAFSHFATPPFDYRKNLTGVAGFEPTHEGVKVPCLTAWLYPKKVEESGFEPLNQKERIYSPPRLATSLLLHMFFKSTIK